MLEPPVPAAALESPAPPSDAPSSAAPPSDTPDSAASGTSNAMSSMTTDFVIPLTRSAYRAVGPSTVTSGGTPALLAYSQDDAQSKLP
jgi:hypothetical protein